jgi:anti-sigma factor (TIGR02949 family)
MSPHDHNHQACRELFTKLSEYLDRELDSATAKEIQRHLEDCPPCQSCLSTLERTVKLCGAMSRQPVPEDFSQRLMELMAQASQEGVPPKE